MTTSNNGGVLGQTSPTSDDRRTAPDSSWAAKNPQIPKADLTLTTATTELVVASNSILGPAIQLVQVDQHVVKDAIGDYLDYNFGWLCYFSNYAELAAFALMMGVNHV